MHAGQAQTLDRAHRAVVGRPEAARGVVSFLKWIATALGLFFRAKEASLHVESAPAQRQREAARRHLWSDGGDLGR